VSGSTRLVRRILAGIGAVAVGAVMAAGAWQGYRAVLAQPLRHVVFEGQIDHVPAEELEALTRAIQEAPGGASLDAVRDAARRVPWVRDAAVRRKWPDTVVITFTAHDALARWGDGQLVSPQGVVFPGSDTAALPRFRGPDGSSAAMAVQFPPIARALAPLGSPIARFDLSARGAWQATLANGLVIELGRADVVARAERFAAMWPRLAGEGLASPVVDLRYPNGFAIKRAATTKTGDRPGTP
jgi:cell division protein FtsQ